MTTYNELVKLTAASVRSYHGLRDLENAVWEAVCGADQDQLAEHLELSDDWASTGHCNDWWAQRNTPNFPDSTTLGDWAGFDLASVMEFCQDVFNALAEQNGI